MESNAEDLNALWNEPWMWDTVIICEGGAQAGSAHGAQQAGQEEVNDNAGGGDALSTFYSDKSLLATESTWFRLRLRMGYSALNGAGTPVSPFEKILICVNCPQVPAARLSVILNFIHTGEFSIENPSQDGILDLLETATYLGMARVIRFLEKKLFKAMDDAAFAEWPIPESPGLEAAAAAPAVGGQQQQQ